MYMSIIDVITVYILRKEKFMWKKVKIKRGVLSLLLVLGLILTNFSPMGARAEGSPGQDKSDLLKSKTVVKVYQREDANTLKEITGGQNITIGEPVTIAAEFTLPLKKGVNAGADANTYIQQGDKASLVLGDSIKFKTGFPDEKKTLEIRGEYGTKKDALFGHVTFEADNAKGIVANFIFDGNDEVFNNASEIKGGVRLEFDISDKAINGIDENKNIKIIDKTFKVGEVKSGIKLSKEGKFDLNTSTIEWTIAVESKDALNQISSLKDYVLTDNLKDAGEYVANSFGVYKDENGTQKIDDVPVPVVNGNTLTFTFNDKFDGSKVYIKLKTKPFKDYGYGKLVKEVIKTNKVTIKKDKEEKSASADVKIEKNMAKKVAEKQGNAFSRIEKENGVDWYKVDWKVTFNQENYKLTNVVITDVIQKNSFKMQPVFDKASLEVFNKGGQSVKKKDISVEPQDGKYSIKDLTGLDEIEGKVELKLTTKIEADKVPYRTAFSNRASIKWGDGLKDLIEVTGEVELPIGNGPVSKNVVNNTLKDAHFNYDGSKKDFTSYDIEWEIKSNKDNIKDGDSIYDTIIFDKKFIDALKDENKVAGTVNKVVFKDGNDTKTDLFDKDVVITQYLRCYHKYLGLSGKYDSVKVYKVYCEGYGDNGYVGDMIEITGLKAGEEKSVRFKTRIINPQTLLGVAGAAMGTNHGPIMNSAFVVRNKKTIYRIIPWLGYSGRMLRKQALVKEVNEEARSSKTEPLPEILNKADNIVGNKTVDNKTVDHENADYKIANNKTADNKDAYNKADKSILYRISVNASGVKDPEGYIKDIKLEDILGAGWEFADVVKGKKVLVYEGEADNSKDNYDSEDEFVRAKKLLTDEEVEKVVTVEPDTVTEKVDGKDVTKNVLRLKFAGLNGPYVVLLKAVIKADADIKTLNNANGTMENQAKFYIGGYAKTKRLALGFKTEMFGKTVSEMKKDLEGNPYLEWNIVYEHEKALENKELKIVDELEGKHYFRGKTENGKFTPVLSEGSYKLEKWDVTEGKYVSVEDISGLISFESSQKLTLKLPEKNTSYKFTYVTDLIQDENTTGYSNKAALMSGDTSILEKKEGYQLSDAAAWGGASKTAKIKLVKVNEKDEYLKDVEFTFENPKTGKKHTTKTDNDGSIEVASLDGEHFEDGNKYLIKEVKVPDGYVNKPVEVAVNITKTDAGRFVKEIVAVTGDAIITSEGIVKVVNKTKPTSPNNNGGGNPPSGNGGDNPPSGNGGGNPPSGNGGSNPPSGNGGSNPPKDNGDKTPPKDNGGSTPPSSNGGNTPTNPNPPVPNQELPRYPETNFPDPNEPGSPDEFVAVGDDGTPLGKYVKRKKPDGSNEYIKVDEDGTPQGAGKGKNSLPKTGGEGTTVYYASGAMLLLLAAGTVVVRRKKYSK